MSEPSPDGGGVLAEIRRALRDPSAPMPSSVWVVLAVLLSLSLFLSVRLLAVRLGGPGGPAAAGSPAARPGSDKITAVVERWRRAWEAKDLHAFLTCYAPTFGAQGKDLAEWSKTKAHAFESREEVRVGVEDLQVTVGEAIAIVSFLQTYRSAAYEDRGRKRLYLLPLAGEWRIFSEDWEPLEPEAPPRDDPPSSPPRPDENLRQ